MDEITSISSDFLQKSRVLRVTSSLGDDVLLPERAHVVEGVNQLFEIVLSVRSKQDIAPADLIGKSIDVELEISKSDDDGNELYRPFNGIVTELHEGPAVTRGLRSYHLIIRPALWLLSQTRESRIWMDKTTIDVLDTLLSEHGLPIADVSGIVTPAPHLHYSCQFNESDLRYLLRRLEHDGYFYWFTHEKGSHKLHVANHQFGWLAPSKAARGEGRVRLSRGSADHNHINEWMRRFSYIPGKRTCADWNYKTFGTIPLNTTPSLVDLPGNAQREIFEWPGRAMTMEDAERVEKLRAQATDADHQRVTGASTVRFLEAGRRFQPYDVANPDAEYEKYVITRAEHIVVDRSYETTTSEPEYRNSFEALPSELPLTPHRQTAKPRIEGLQVAVVAGPQGEEIHCDSDGCIKLWFPWQRGRAKKDGSDTMWIRVATNWAGQGWGGQVIPRIGMEVLVACLDGDPDRPIVVGLVPNPKNNVPYELPANKTKTVFRTNTHKSKSWTEFNEISFDDATGNEELFFHAQKDRTEKTLNNFTSRIDNNYFSSVGRNALLSVRNNYEHIAGGNYHLSVGSGFSTETLLPAQLSAIFGIREMGYQLNSPLETPSTRGNYVVECAASAYMSVGRNKSESVIGFSYNNIGSDFILNVSGDSLCQVAGDQRSTISGDSIDNVSGRKTILSADIIRIISGKSSIELIPDGTIKVTGKNIVIEGEDTVTLKTSRNNLKLS